MVGTPKKWQSLFQQQEQQLIPVCDLLALLQVKKKSGENAVVQELCLYQTVAY